MKKINLSIVIPCLNEKQTIKRAIEDAKKYSRLSLGNNYEVIVADNGSTDGTLDILKKDKGVKIVHVPVRGYGAALHWGIMNAKGDYVIFADADLSYPFSNINKFSKMTVDEPDMVSGTRLGGTIQKGAMPFLHRYFGTPALTFLINVLYKMKSTDCNCGMRMVKRSFYKKLNMKSSGMEWASELLLKTALRKGKFEEVPIKYLKDKRGKSPHLSTWSDGWRQFKTIILLKPQSLYLPLVAFFLLAVYYYSKNFALTFLFAELFIVLVLSLFTLNLIGSTIDHKPTKISKFLIEFRLVPITAIISLAVGTFIILIPNSRLGTKLFLVSTLGVIFMWIFFIETIKTHLVNKLPDDKNNS